MFSWVSRMCGAWLVVMGGVEGVDDSCRPWSRTISWYLTSPPVIAVHLPDAEVEGVDGVEPDGLDLLEKRRHRLVGVPLVDGPGRTVAPPMVHVAPLDVAHRETTTFVCDLGRSVCPAVGRGRRQCDGACLGVTTRHRSPAHSRKHQSRKWASGKQSPGPRPRPQTYLNTAGSESIVSTTSVSDTRPSTIPFGRIRPNDPTWSYGASTGSEMTTAGSPLATNVYGVTEIVGT